VIVHTHVQYSNILFLDAVYNEISYVIIFFSPSCLYLKPLFKRPLFKRQMTRPCIQKIMVKERERQNNVPLPEAIAAVAAWRAPQLHNQLRNLGDAARG